jgi:hypothetical protein
MSRTTFRGTLGSRLWSCSRRCGDPSALLHVYAPFGQNDSFGLKQASLKARARLRYEQPSAGAHDTMPGNSFSAVTCRHRMPGRAGAAFQADRFRERSVGCYAAARNFFHQVVNRIPRRHCPLPLFFVADFPEELLSKARSSEFRSRLLSQQIKHLRECEVMSGRLLSSKSFSGRAARSSFVPLTPFRGMLQD